MSEHRRIESEWAVDHRDQPPAFACIVVFPDRESALREAKRTGAPLLRRDNVITTEVGAWTEVYVGPSNFG